jgi:hypothetical protein
MHFSGPDRGAMTPGERWFAGLVVVIIIGLFAAELATNYQPAKLSVLFFVLFWVPLLVLHEAGHAVVAALVGWHVGRVVIGIGRTVGQFHVGETLVEIRLVPTEGFVQLVPRNLLQPHLKSALIYFAGPGAELLVLGLICLLVGPSTLLTQSESIGLLAIQSLCVAILAGAFFNLIPHQIYTPAGPIANDGLGIIQSFRRHESEYAEQIGRRYDEVEGAWKEHDSADWWKR